MTHDRGMIFNSTGKVVDNFYCLGHTWMPVYLLDGPEPVLFEGGLACLGRIYADAIQTVLKGRAPERLFLTHVHYDHCGATAYLTKVFPQLRVAASAQAAHTITRPNAQKLMRELSATAAALITGVDRGKLLADAFAPFTVDTIVSDGDIIPLKGGLSVEALATPGHTRDMLSYYIPERKILIATEAAGCADMTGHVVPQFLVDYERYMQSLRRLAALDVEVLCQGHNFIYVRTAVKDFFARSIESAVQFRQRAEALLAAEGGSVERVVAIIKAEERDGKPFPKQPDRAYLIGLNARVKHLAEKRSGRA
jgi:glyoxylase-like metal-dependent hydrolase (beta-lactamase superfamily II)